MGEIKPAIGCRIEGDDWLLHVKVQPGASRTLFAGPLGQQQKLCVKSPPVDGAANKVVIEFIAKSFGVSKSAVAIDKGQTGRLKTLRINSPKKIPAALCDE